MNWIWILLLVLLFVLILGGFRKKKCACDQKEETAKPATT